MVDFKRSNTRLLLRGTLKDSDVEWLPSRGYWS